MKHETGWFSDINDETDECPGMYQPFYQLPGTGVFSVNVWLDTKEACDEFIDDWLLNMNMVRMED